MTALETTQSYPLLGQAIAERSWSAGEALRLAALEHEQARRWIEAAVLAEATIRRSADGGAPKGPSQLRRR